jgi:hypothetical protein
LSSINKLAAGSDSESSLVLVSSDVDDDGAGGIR